MRESSQNVQSDVAYNQITRFALFTLLLKTLRGTLSSARQLLRAVSWTILPLSYSHRGAWL